MTNLLGAGLNILLDPLLIFGLNMGIAGAAWATLLSQAASALWVLVFFCSKKTQLHIRLQYMRPSGPILKKIIGLGASPFFMTSTEGVLTLSFNQQLLRFGGVQAVSSMTILASMFQLLLLPMEGVAQGAQPILSYNYGAELYQRVRNTIALALRVNLTWSLLATTAILVVPAWFIGWFIDDPAFIERTIPMLRIYVIGCLVMGANSTFQQTYTALGLGVFSFFFAFLRKIILLIPLIFILPLFNRMVMISPVLLVICAEPVSDLITTTVNALNFRKMMQRYLFAPSSCANGAPSLGRI